MAGRQLLCLGPAVIGDGFVNLEATATDSSAAASGLYLDMSLAVYANGDPRDTFAGGELDTPSGQSAILQLTQAELQNAVSKYGRDGEVSVTWTARAAVKKGSDGPVSPTSHLASCTFTFNEADPSTPSLWADSGHTTACDSLSGASIGKPVTIYVTSPGRATKATVPLSYSYSLNSGNSVTVAAARPPRTPPRSQ